MFPSLHPQKKGSSSDTSSKEQKAKQNTYGLSSATKSSGSSRRARMGVYQKKTPSFSPSSSSVSPPPSQKGFSAPGARFATDAECTATPVEIPMTPVVHSTTWRRLVVGKAPPNIITGVSARPYSYGFDRPLWTFDTTGVLREKCKFRAVDSDSATAEASIQIQPPSQSEVNERVRCLVDQELPRIKKCHVQRVRHTLKSTRQQLAAYFKGHRELRSERYRRLQWLEIANHRSRSDISAGERVTAKRLLRNSAHIGLPYNCLVGTVRFFVHQDKPPFESVVYPETVIYLPNDITAICQSFAMIGINKNAFVEDDPILRYVPYLGDGQELVVDNDLYSGTTMSRERQIAVFGDNGELKVLKPSARDNEIQEYLLRVIVGTCGASERVFLALEEEVGFSQPRIDYCEMKEQAKAAELTAKRVAKAKKLVALYQKSLIDGQSGHSVGSENASKALFNLAQHCWFLRSTSEHQSFGVRLQPPLSVFESSYADTPEAHGIRDRASYEGLVEWHRDLFCRRCYSYDCSEHGIQNPQRSSRADPIYPMITAPGVVLSMEEAMSREGGIGAKECSSNVVTLSVESEEAIQIAGGESSSSLDDEAQKNKRQPISVDQPSSESAALNRRSRRTQTQLSSMASKSLQSQEKLLDIQRLAKLKKRNKRREMFLRAPDNSEYLDDSDAAVMAFHPNLNTQSCYDLHICCNVNMLRNSIQKRIGVAFSATHGWGAFALESIRKDEFVLEYTGELITDDEAERRGAMYDRKLVSYLFGVNSEYVVDAARKGNKAKFANHRAKRKANLNVKVIVSNGEHRIGLFAREAIEVGAELFFDYGYTHESAPNWSHRGKSMSEQFVHDKVDTVDEENE
ncbi:unnamed protein product [Hyaloperonospora brassicae]|uniref:SET domain-containing protein n=1 Tax=Hyaloperonospora brassicae TaxID=162125 RepID=A0AAV0T2B5_HYABA|nr:unnamed protein product [Hyaloperonospora brassicae]